MYASVEMLLKFYAERFFSELALANRRGGRASAPSRWFFVMNIPHWLPRHFTRELCLGRIHSLLAT